MRSPPATKAQGGCSNPTCRRCLQAERRGRRRLHKLGLQAEPPPPRMSPSRHCPSESVPGCSSSGRKSLAWQVRRLSRSVPEEERRKFFHSTQVDSKRYFLQPVPCLCSSLKWHHGWT